MIFSDVLQVQNLVRVERWIWFSLIVQWRLIWDATERYLIKTTTFMWFGVSRRTAFILSIWLENSLKLSVSFCHSSIDYMCKLSSQWERRNSFLNSAIKFFHINSIILSISGLYQAFWSLPRALTTFFSIAISFSVKKMLHSKIHLFIIKSVILPSVRIGMTFDTGCWIVASMVGMATRWGICAANMSFSKSKSEFESEIHLAVCNSVHCFSISWSSVNMQKKDSEVDNDDRLDTSKRFGNSPSLSWSSGKNSSNGFSVNWLQVYRLWEMVEHWWDKMVMMIQWCIWLMSKKSGSLWDMSNTSVHAV